MKKDDSIYRTLLEAAAEGIVVVDAGGRIVMVNGKAEELFGYRQEELLGTSVDILLPESRREVHRSHRAGYMTDPHDRPMGMGLDLVARRRDGSEFPAEIALTHAGDGEDMLVMASVNDITQRKEWEREKTRYMEERIRELEDTLNALGQIARPPAASVTARMMGLLPLQESAPGVFAELVQEYGRIMDKALEHRIYKVEESLSPLLERLATRLGFLRATARDVVLLHSTVLQEKSHAETAARTRGYLQEGHFLLVELIGYLATYYRNRALFTEERKEPGTSGAPRKGGA